MPEPPRSGTVLLVEDQPDLRDLLAITLQKEGYIVALAGSAAEALRLLRLERYALVVTHYGLPHMTGMALLQQATAEGLLEGTHAMIITAHADIGPGADFPVLKKPLDLRVFVDQVRTMAAPRRAAVLEIKDKPEGELKAELVFYYTPPWPHSVRAHEVLLRVLEGFNPAQVSLRLCDLSQECQTEDDENILFSPTLVKRHPSPPMWLVGDLGTGEAVVDLLQLCGVEERPPQVRP
jgi:CheY-like chemotaxis protein